MQHYMIKFVSDLWQVDQWFPLGTPVSSMNKTDRHDATKILLKMALNHHNSNPHLLSLLSYIFISKRREQVRDLILIRFPAQQDNTSLRGVVLCSEETRSYFFKLWFHQ